MLHLLPEGAKVLIIRLRSLGDCVLTTPAIHLLKNFRPDLRIAVAVEDRFADIFRGNSDINAVLPPHPAACLIWKPKLTLNLHGGTRSLFLTIASAARHRAAFAHFRHLSAYNIPIPRAQQILGEERIVHTAEHLASAVFHLGVPISDIPRARLFAPRIPAESKYAVFHPLASAPDKTWPTDRFLSVARSLYHLEPVFIGGPGDDLSAFSYFRTAVNHSLRDTLTLIQDASLFFGNDSGPAHIAAAFGVPLVALYGTSDPVVWAPWKTRAEPIAAHGPIANITLEQALAAVQALGADAE